MKKLFCSFVFAALMGFVFTGCGNPTGPEGETVPDRVEREDWQKASQAYTISAFTQYLQRHPEGVHVDEARSIIASLEAAEKQTPRMVNGTVKSVNEPSGTVTITTPMRKAETFRVNANTRIQKKNENRSLKDLEHAKEGVKIDYVNLPDGTLLAKKVAIGYSVSRCSCGSNCACPLSRGCRAVRY